MRIKQIAVFVVLLVSLSRVWGASPLVDANWLASNLDNPKVVVLDLQPQEMYNQYHVPGAINSNYGDWRRPSPSGVPKLMPPIDYLEFIIGKLGISNDLHVVLVVTGRGAGEMASATRVYWTFKALGHENISILDGGLIAYANKVGNKLERKPNHLEKTKYKASPNLDYLVTAKDVKSALDSGVTMVDSRSVAEYLGIISGGRKERPGTIPGSINLPYDWLTVNGSASFHSKDNLKRIYQARGISLDGEQISFCHTGHRTSLSWFVSHELLGNKNAKMYDGSTVEWSSTKSLPVEQKIQLTCMVGQECPSAQ